MDKFIIRTPIQTHQATRNEQPVPVPSTSVESYNGSKTITSSGKKKKGRQFRDTWIVTYPWITYDCTLDKVFCTICRTAAALKLPIASTGINSQRVLSTYVTEGFNSWGKALERFKDHEKSEFHRHSALSLRQNNQGVNVANMLSKSKLKDMTDARKCLLTIFSTIKYLTVQGIAVRGHFDSTSNFNNLLHLRANDIPELQSWLGRTGYKWLSHDISNEVISILSNAVQRIIHDRVRSQEFFSIIADETSDISVSEQMSFCLRSVNASLEVEEYFIGVHETESTTADVLYNMIRDVLLRCQLKIGNCRGQCYDGAANMSGCVNGVQKKILLDEPRAIYVHCYAHRVNLVVQDSFQKILHVRDFLSDIKDIVTFIRDSPKRLSHFKLFQGSDKSPALRPFCPTRWCVRVESLKSFLKNYENIIEFLEQQKSQPSDGGSKASGFLNKISDFRFYFLLKCIILIFERIETLNTILQGQALDFNKATKQVETVKTSLLSIRNEARYDELWTNVTTESEQLDLNEPILPKRRKVSRKVDDMRQTEHNFDDVKQFYRQMYYEIIDMTVTSLTTRFEGDTLKHLRKVEAFALDKAENANYVTSFYKEDFDGDRLALHRNMFLDITSQRNVELKSIQDIVTYLRSHSELYDIVPEYLKFIKLLLVIPVSSCTAERSFSSLRRLKSFLRSTMSQKRLNDVMILNVHGDIVENLDLEQLCNEFIKRSSVRMNSFSLFDPREK